MKMPQTSIIPRVTIEVRGGYKTFDSPYGKDYLGEFSTQRKGSYSGNCDGNNPSYFSGYAIYPATTGVYRCYQATVVTKYILFS